MGGFNAHQDSGLIGEINVTPFVDITLVLLIVFMSTSAVIVRTALDLEIPVASNAEATDTSVIQSVWLKSDDSLELNGEKISRPALVETLAGVVSENRNNNTGNRETQVLVSATANHNYQQVVALINIVKGSGVNSIALNTKTEPETEPEKDTP